jgi:hypothetical protein
MKCEGMNLKVTTLDFTILQHAHIIPCRFLQILVRPVQIVLFGIFGKANNRIGESGKRK